MNLPEPSLPEHELIRLAATTPTLSAGLKQRVMSECGSQIRLSRLKFRMGIAVSTAAACGLLFLVLTRQPPESGRGDAGIVAEQQQPSITPATRGSGYGSAANATDVAGHEAMPQHSEESMEVPRETQQINRLIEERLRRNKMLECAFLPFL